MDPSVLGEANLARLIWQSKVLIVAIVDSAGILRALSQSGGSISTHPAVGSQLTDLVTPEQGTALRLALERATDDWSTQTFGFPTSPDGLVQDYRCSFQRIQDQIVVVAEPEIDMRLNVLDGLLGIAEAIASERREIESEKVDLHRLALTDEATGLLNRRGFTEQAPFLVAAAHRTKQPLSVVFVDIDRFKRINDELGHPEGDVLLRSFASLLRDAVRTGDLAVRYGGEEFVVILPRSAATGATEWSERVRRTIASELKPSDGRQVTASFGVAELKPGESIQDVVRRADAALYEAKAGGRNRTVRAE